jgi:DNA-directed RNA polymerase subunit RPC12/RpoP
MAEFQRRVMARGEDYGVVKGIDRPFLHLPGAEKMSLLYGFAVRQEADRITGDGVAAPPLAYHVRSYVHLGSFDGPVVGMGYGEASCWETKYRYRDAERVCPKCGHEGLIKGKPDGKLKGKWWDAAFKGGCNATFEAADPAITDQVVGKVENTDPWSLAETLVQMAAKRSFVAAIRRATGTSGLFTQDDDSPSVQAQADTSPDGDETPSVVNVTGEQQVERGGKPAKPTPQQTAELSRLSKEKGLGPDGIAKVITRLFDVPVLLPDGTRGEQGKWLLGYIAEGLTADQMGQVLETIATGEVPEAKA